MTSTRTEQDWWVPLFRGAWLAIAGTVALFAGSVNRPLLSFLFATSALIAGGVLMTNGVGLRLPHAIFQGAVSLAIGLLLLVLPLDAERWQATAIGTWAIIIGGVDVAVAVRQSNERGRVALVVAGGLSVVAGVVALLASRFPALSTLPTFGGLALCIGLALLAHGWARRPHGQRATTMQPAT